MFCKIHGAVVVFCCFIFISVQIIIQRCALVTIGTALHVVDEHYAEMFLFQQKLSQQTYLFVMLS